MKVPYKTYRPTKEELMSNTGLIEMITEMITMVHNNNNWNHLKITYETSKRGTLYIKAHVDESISGPYYAICDFKINSTNYFLNMLKLLRVDKDYIIKENLAYITVNEILNSLAWEMYNDTDEEDFILWLKLQ